MTIDMVLQNIKELCEKYHAEQIILFGSRAKGTALERSDIDIAVSELMILIRCWMLWTRSRPCIRSICSIWTHVEMS